MVLSATLRAGVSAFTKAVSSEFAEYNITLNVICPGGVLTDRLSSLIQKSAETTNRNYDELLAESQNMIPAKRFANPNEIANMATFLCSEAGSYITGTSIMVDGGLTKSYF
jgi:3-oxoacyl-[acyl-carrier protein] reductase